MPRPLRKDLQVNDHRPRLSTATAPEGQGIEPQIAQIYADYAQGRTGTAP